MKPTTMRRHISCPACAERVSVPAYTSAGTRARCGACSRMFRVPEPPELTEASLDGDATGRDATGRDATGEDAIRSTLPGRRERRRRDLEVRSHPVRRSGVLEVDGVLQVGIEQLRRGRGTV